MQTGSLMCSFSWSMKYEFDGVSQSASSVSALSRKSVISRALRTVSVHFFMEIPRINHTNPLVGSYIHLSEMLSWLLKSQKV